MQNITNLQLGALLQICFSEGVRNQLSQDYREFEQVKRWRVGNTQARQVNFMIQTSYGPAAIQYRNPGTSNRTFPQSQQSTISEHSAIFKEVNATVELEWNLYDRAMNSPEKYALPLALEIQNKTIGSRRRIAADLYGDGTGVIAECAATSAAVTAPASDKLVFTLDEADDARGGIGLCEFGDILVLKAEDGTASALDTSLATEPAYWKVVKKDRKNGKVTLQGLDANLESAGTIASITTNATAGDVFYRYGQPTIPDLTAISDYATATEVFAGLESLTAADARVVHGITMDGASAGTVLDQSAAALDANMIQEAMDTVKVNVGQDQYKWAKMCMAPENHAKLINSRETDRRFMQVTDNKRGVKYFAYVHGNDEVEAYTSEFVSKQRIIGLPEQKNGQKVMEYYGSDYKPVKMPGSGEFHLKPSADGGHVNNVVSYLHGILVLLCKHPAAVWTIRNFS